VSDIVRLIPADEAERRDASAGLVRLLEDALEEARAGTWTHGLLILENGERFSCRWQGAEDVIRRVGMIERLKHDWMAE
jgi:hypothetical protein